MRGAVSRVIHSPRPHWYGRWGRHHGVVVVKIIVFEVAIMQSRRVTAAVAVSSGSRHTRHRKTLAPVPTR